MALSLRIVNEQLQKVEGLRCGGEVYRGLVGSAGSTAGGTITVECTSYQPLITTMDNVVPMRDLVYVI